MTFIALPPEIRRYILKLTILIEAEALEKSEPGWSALMPFDRPIAIAQNPKLIKSLRGRSSGTDTYSGSASDS
jgi:hypothetical protein